VTKVVGIKKAHQQLSKLIQSAEDGQQIVITRDGVPSAVLLGVQEYDSLVATLEETADPGALRTLREAQADVKTGRLYSYEKVFGHLPLRLRSFAPGGRKR
jgi:antitoxin YefM